MRRLVVLLVMGLLIAAAPRGRAAEEVISVGHMVKITVLAHAELSQTTVVREDGTTDYPLLANIPIDGMTVQELSTLLAPILTRYVERPLFFVSISEYRILNIRVLGQVRQPGPMTVKEPIGLQGVLAKAGGILETADMRNITIIREQEQGGTKEIKVDLYELYRDDTEAERTDIQNGDLIIVPVITARSSVKVLGEVRTPGKFVPMQDENVADLIYRAGGVTRDADLNNVTLILLRDGSYRSERVKLRSMIQHGEAENIPLVKAGDIIVVGELKLWKDLSFWALTIRDIAYLVSSVYLLSRLN